MSAEVRIQDTAQYIEMVCKENVEDEFWRSELLFRGQSNKEYKLLPSLARDRHSACSSTIFNDERNLIDMAKYKMPDIFKDELSPIELLALLQHYGIPTRLMDVTESALVALYFACISNPDKDGEVIVFRHLYDKITNYPIINAIADSYRFATRDTWRPLSLFYGDIKRQPYFLEQQQVNEICHKDDKAGGEWISQCCQKLLYIYAPIRSMRQQVQQGRYILFPNNITEKDNSEKCFEWMINEIPKEHPDIVKRIIIPKEIKKQCIKDLNILGVNRGFLFCDSTDIVCDEILNKFKSNHTFS